MTPKLSPMSRRSKFLFAQLGLLSDAPIDPRRVGGRTISSAALKGFFGSKGDSGWADFHRRYPEPQGYSSFSRVGFNEKKEQALVFVSYAGGWLNSRCDYVFLVRKGTEWVVQETISLLAS
jgi:hypothetical protein